MKTVLALTGLLVSLAISAPAITLDGLAVTDSNVGNLRLSGTLSAVGLAGGVVVANMTDSLGMIKLYTWPDMVTYGQTAWNNTNFNVYFQGAYTVSVQPVDFISGAGVAAQVSHTISAARVVSGTLNTMQYQTGDYNADGTWTAVDTDKAKMHCIGYATDYGTSGVNVVACNLLNNLADIGDETDQDTIEALFGDISEHYPAGTHFRFQANLHKKPTTFMGMGEIQRYTWVPQDAADPSGPGVMYLDITSCGPWRSAAASPLRAHVGFAPVFLDNPEWQAEFGDTFMWTTAHYMDIHPVISENNRVGLVIGGHPGTTNYLSVVVPDGLLERWGVTDPLTELAGYLNDVMVGTSATTITRIEDGGQPGGNAGYLIRFEFVFPAVAASKAANSSVKAEIGVAGDNLPAPDVRINGSVESVTVNYGDMVTVTARLTPGQYSSLLVDWWMVAETPLGFYYYGADYTWHAQNDLARMRPVYQGALTRLNSTTVLRSAGLPLGNYKFYFGVSYPSTGVLDISNPYLIYAVDILHIQ